MGILRKLRKLASCRLRQNDRASPRPRVRHHHAAPSNMVYGPLPNSFFQAVNSARDVAGYDPLPVLNRGPTPEENLFHQHQQWQSAEKSLNRDRRHASAEQLHLPPGTPIKFRRRPVSPDLLQHRGSLPSLRGSPEASRRFAQMDRQPEMCMPMDHHPAPFVVPHFQQPFYPIMHPHGQPPGWFVMPPQQPVHLFY